MLINWSSLFHKKSYNKGGISDAVGKPTLIDIAREVPKSTLRVGKMISNLAVGIAQKTASSGGSIAVSVMHLLGAPSVLRDEDLKPSFRKIKHIIYGDDPVKSLATRIAEGEVSIKRFAQRHNIPILGKVALPLSFAGVGLSTGLDFTGLGGEEGVISKLAKTSKIEEVGKILKDIGITDEIATKYAPTIAKTKKLEEVKNILSQAHEELVGLNPKYAPRIRGFIKNVREVNPRIPIRVGGYYIPRSTDELSIKAKNLIKDNIEEAERVARSDLGDKSIATASELIKYYSDKAAEIEARAKKLVETKIPKELEPLKKEALKIAQKYPDNPEKGAEEFERVFVAQKSAVGVVKNMLKRGEMPEAKLDYSGKIVKLKSKPIDFESAKKIIGRKLTSEENAILAQEFIASKKYESPSILRRTKARANKVRKAIVREAQEVIKKEPEKFIPQWAKKFDIPSFKDFYHQAVKEAKKTEPKISKEEENLANLFYEKAADIAHYTAKRLTEEGRAIQAASILGRTTPAGFLRFAAKEINRYNEAVEKSPFRRFIKKIPDLTGEEAKEILSEFKKISEMPDGEEKAIATRYLLNKIQDRIPTSLFKKVITLWKAGLLTGIRTSGLNIMANLSHGLSETIKDVPGAAVDSVASLFTKERKLVFTTRGVGSGVKEGFERGWKYLKTGYDERNVAIKFDYNRISFGQGKIAKGLQKYEETIFHILGAEDQPFYYGAKARSLFSQALAIAKNKGLRGAERDKFVDYLIKNPTDEMIRYAQADAEMAVFQNPTTLGKAAKAIQKVPIVGEVVVPFSTTPAAVANQLINYSPVGIVKAIATEIARGKFDQRLFSQAMGRGITGTALMYLGRKLYKKGLISLDYPKTEKERKLWELEGRSSFSVKLNNKWRNIGVLGPAGYTLVVGATFERALQELGTITGALEQATFTGIKSLKEQTFLQGINQIVTALTDPEKSAEKWFSNMAASIIPILVKDVASAIDTKQRRYKGVVQTIKSRIPLLRETLQPRVNVFGKEVKRKGNFLEILMDPSRPSPIIRDSTAQELRRLMEEGYRVAPTQLGKKMGYDVLTPEENTALWEYAGELIDRKLTALFSLKQYQELPDDEKAKYVSQFIKMSNDLARARMVMELTSGLRGQELKEELHRLKEGGLLNLDVFRIYLQLNY